MRLMQHKREAFWFYRYLSVVYERVNSLFWTAPMRARALALAHLDEPALRVLDVGAGTGFATEGIVERVDPGAVTMLDQSPHQLAIASGKAALGRVTKVLGDAEQLPFADEQFDRYVSAGSIEYWPDPQRAIAEAYRVVAEGGWAMVVGPLPPASRVARWLADVWMLFPREADYVRWFEQAGFVDLQHVHVAPDWHSGDKGAYGIAIAGRKPAPGRSPLKLASPLETRAAPLSAGARLRFAGRFVLGSAAGALFVPIAALLSLRNRLRRER